MSRSGSLRPPRSVHDRRRIASVLCGVPLAGAQCSGDAVAALADQPAERGGLGLVGQPLVRGRQGAGLDDRREQVLDGVLGDLAGAPVPQRADLLEVPLDVARGELPLGRVPEARGAAPRARRSVRRRRGRSAARSPPSTPWSAGARGPWRRGGPRSPWRPVPPPPRSRRPRLRRSRRVQLRKAQRASASTTSPSIVREPSSSPRSTAACACVRTALANVRDHSSCTSLAAGADSSAVSAESASRVHPVGAHAGSVNEASAVCTRASSDWTTLLSVSAPTPASTSCTQSRAASSASRVMSQPADQHSARASGSVRSPIRLRSVASERSSRRSLA